MAIPFNDKNMCFLLDTSFRQLSILDFSFTQIKELFPYLKHLLQFYLKWQARGMNTEYTCLQFTHIYLQGPAKVEQKINEKGKQIPYI